MQDSDTSSLKQQFDEQGYAVVEDVLDDVTLDSLEADYLKLIDHHAPRWLAEGLIPELFDNLPLYERAGRIVSYLNHEEFRWFDIAFGQAQSPETQIPNFSQPVFNLLTHHKLLDCIEALIGGEILVNPIHHVRIKPPQSALKAANPSSLVKATGWHQDQGVARSVADETAMITAWVAINDATVDNGCLSLVPYSHKQGLTTHCTGNDLTIPNVLIDEANVTPIPVKRGGVLLMHRQMHHSSTPNRSNGIRWSFDLRFQPIGQPTGRDEFPSFIARSRQNPDSVSVDYPAWVNLWQQTEAWMRVQDTFEKSHRWSGDAEVCA